MTEQDDLKNVFTGSNVDANFVKSMLEESGIGALVRNTLRESLVAGWVSGAPEDSSRVFVTENHYDKAMEIVSKYLDSSDKS